LAVQFANKADAIFNDLNALALKHVENAVNRRALPGATFRPPRAASATCSLN